MRFKWLPNDLLPGIVKCCRLAKSLSIRYADISFFEYPPFDARESCIENLERGAEISKLAGDRAVWFKRTTIDSRDAFIIILFGYLVDLRHEVIMEEDRLLKLLEIQEVMGV